MPCRITVTLVGLLCAACTGAIATSEPAGSMPEPGATPGPVGPGNRPGLTPGPGSQPPAGPEPQPPGTASVGPRPVQRLSRSELILTLRDLLGITDLREADLPEDAAAESGFSVGGVVSTSDARRLLELAETIGARVEARLPALVPCEGMAEEPCARLFVTQFGRRAFRRPLAPAETEALVAYYRGARADLGLTHPGGLRMTVQVMLQSSRFLYRWELGPTAPARPGAIIRLDAHELASRLSYFLWGTMPDTALFGAADTGALTTPAESERQARRMLADPRAAASIARFHREWLRLGDLEGLQKSAKEWDGTLARAAEDELDQFTKAVVLGDGAGKLETLLTAPWTVASPALNKIYGVAAGTGTTARRLDLDAGQRSGLLTQTAFLAANATASESHPVRRGVRILERVLCTPPPPVPDDVPEPKPAAAGLSTRERFAEHGKNACANACHALMDPLGFAFESFDAIGRWRATDGGKPVDASGSVTLPSGAKVSFRNAVELTRALAASDDVAGCVARQWLRFVLGRHEDRADDASLAEARQALAASKNDLRELLVALTRSAAFTTRSASPGEVLQ